MELNFCYINQIVTSTKLFNQLKNLFFIFKKRFSWFNRFFSQCYFWNILWNIVWEAKDVVNIAFLILYTKSLSIIMLIEIENRSMTISSFRSNSWLFHLGKTMWTHRRLDYVVLFHATSLLTSPSYSNASLSLLCMHQFPNAMPLRALSPFSMQSRFRGASQDDYW